LRVFRIPLEFPVEGRQAVSPARRLGRGARRGRFGPAASAREVAGAEADQRADQERDHRLWLRRAFRVVRLHAGIVSKTKRGGSRPPRAIPNLSIPDQWEAARLEAERASALSTWRSTSFSSRLLMTAISETMRYFARSYIFFSRKESVFRDEM